MKGKERERAVTEREDVLTRQKPARTTKRDEEGLATTHSKKQDKKTTGGSMGVKITHIFHTHHGTINNNTNHQKSEE
jgi:hypothetical protein